MSDDHEDDEPSQEPDPDDDPSSEADGQKLSDLIRGEAVTPATKAHMDKIIGDLTKGLARPVLPNLGPKLAGLDKYRAIGARLAAQQRDTDDWLEEQKAMWDRQAEAKRAEHQAELDWRAGLLEQQRLTVQAISALNDAQASDRRINVWVLRIAILTLAVSIIAIIVTVLLA